MDRISQFLADVAGVRRDAQARAPHSLAQAATFGTLLLLTSALASVTFGYAVNRAFLGEPYAMPVAVLGGLLWAGIVFSIDRSIILGINKFDTAWGLTRQALVRVPFALIIGLVISKPVILLVSRSMLDADLRKEQRHDVSSEVSANATIENLDQKTTQVSTLDAARTAQEAALRHEPDSYQYRVAREAAQTADARYRAASTANTPRIARGQAELETLAASESLSDRQRSRLEQLRQQIAEWQGETNRAQAAVATAKTRVEREADAWLHAQTARLDEIRKTLDGARESASTAATNVSVRNVESERALGALLRPNLVNEYTTMKRIEGDRNNRDARTMLVFEYSLDALFILLELTPMLIKLGSRISPLDHAVAAVEFEDRERINTAANLTQAQLQKMAAVKQDLHAKAWDALRAHYAAKLQKPSITKAEIEQILEDVRRLAA